MSIVALVLGIVAAWFLLTVSVERRGHHQRKVLAQLMDSTDAGLTEQQRRYAESSWLHALDLTWRNISLTSGSS